MNHWGLAAARPGAPVRLHGVNRAPRWLLPSVLAVLIVAVAIGAIVR